MGRDVTIKIKVNDKEVESSTKSLNRMEKASKDVGKSSKDIDSLGDSFSGLGSKASPVSSIISGLSGKVAVAAGVVAGFVIAITAVAAVLVLVGKHVFNLAKVFAEYAREMKKASDETGLAVSSIAALRLEAQLAGKDFGDIQSSVSTFKDQLLEAAGGNEEAGKSLKSLGLDASTAANDIDGSFKKAIAEISKMPEGVERARVATVLFGKDGQQLIAFAQRFGGEMDVLTKQAEDYGYSLSDLSVKESQEFYEALAKIEFQVKGLGVELGSKLLPIVLDVTKSMSDWVSNNKDEISGFFDIVTGGVQNAVNNIKLLYALYQSAPGILTGFDSKSLEDLAKEFDEQKQKQADRAYQEEIEATKAHNKRVLQQQESAGVEKLKAVEKELKERKNIIEQALTARNQLLENEFRREKAIRSGYINQSIKDQIKAIDEEIKHEKNKYQRKLANLRAYYAEASRIQAQQSSFVGLGGTGNIGGISSALNAMRQGTMMQESGGNIRARNGRTNAMGLFQVMPANVRPWTKEHLGKILSIKEFQRDADAQIKVFNGEMGKYLRIAFKRTGGNINKSIRMAAAAWYGGLGAMNRFDVGKRFRANEPSFREYTTKVLSRSLKFASKGSSGNKSLTPTQNPIGGDFKQTLEFDNLRTDFEVTRAELEKQKAQLIELEKQNTRKAIIESVGIKRQILENTFSLDIEGIESLLDSETIDPLAYFNQINERGLKYFENLRLNLDEQVRLELEAPDLNFADKSSKIKRANKLTEYHQAIAAIKQAEEEFFENKAETFRQAALALEVSSFEQKFALANISREQSLNQREFALNNNNDLTDNQRQLEMLQLRKRNLTQVFTEEQATLQNRIKYAKDEGTELAINNQLELLRANFVKDYLSFSNQILNVEKDITKQKSVQIQTEDFIRNARRSQNSSLVGTKAELGSQSVLFADKTFVANQRLLTVLSERIGLNQEIFDLENRIASVGENSAQRYKAAWLDAILEIKEANISAVESQIRSQVRLADRMTVHTQQVRANVLENLASQRTMTEAIGDGIIDLYDKIAQKSDEFIDNTIGKIPIIGDIAKTVSRNFLTDITTNLLDSFLPPELSKAFTETNNPVAKPIVKEISATNKLLQNIDKNIANSTGGASSASSGLGGVQGLIQTVFGGGASGTARSSSTNIGNGTRTGDVVDGISQVFAGDKGRGDLFSNIKNIFSGKDGSMFGKGGIFGEEGFGNNLGTYQGIGSGLGLIGGLIGGKTGNILSGVGTGIGTGASIGSMIAPGIGTILGSIIGGAVGFFSSLFGNPKQKRDRKEKMPQLEQGFAEAIKQLKEIASDKNAILNDPFGTLRQAESIRDEVQSGFGIKFESKKYRRLSQQRISAKTEEANRIVDEIAAFSERAKAANETDKRLVAQFAGGVYMDSAFKNQYLGFKRRNGLLPGSYSDGDVIPTFLAGEEWVINKDQHANIIRNAGGVDVFRGANIPGYAEGKAPSVKPIVRQQVSSTSVGSNQPINVNIYTSNKGVVESDIEVVVDGRLDAPEVKTKIYENNEKQKVLNRD